MAAGFGGLLEDLQLGVQGPGEVAAKGLTATGGDGRDVATVVEESTEIGQGGGGPRQEIEAELKENRVFKGGLGVGKEFRWRGALDGRTQLAYTQARHDRGRCGVGVHRSGDREWHFLQLTHLKGVLRTMQPGMWAANGFGPKGFTPWAGQRWAGRPGFGTEPDGGHPPEPPSGTDVLS